MLLYCAGTKAGAPSKFRGFHWRFFERYLASIRPQRDASSGAFPEGVLPPLHTWNGYFMSLSMCVPPFPHICGCALLI